jgi:hypothetical protein
VGLGGADSSALVPISSQSWRYNNIAVRRSILLLLLMMMSWHEARKLLPPPPLPPPLPTTTFAFRLPPDDAPPLARDRGRAHKRLAWDQPILPPAVIVSVFGCASVVLAAEFLPPLIP